MTRHALFYHAAVTNASANGSPCARQDESGLHSNKRGPDRREKLYDHDCKHLLQRPRLYQRCCDPRLLGAAKT